MDDVFDALSHPARRTLLDLLNARDGRTLGDLERHLPVSRFAVMKHLKVLEAAHLVTSRKVGREKLHYLNPMPIRDIAARWIDRYAEPSLAALAAVRAAAETLEQTKTMTDTAPAAPRHVYETYIRASAETVWAILTDDAKTPLYQHFDMASKTDWRVGGAIAFFMGERAVIVGEILELDPPRRIVTTFSARWAADVAADQPSRVTWEIVALDPGACKLTLVHDGFGGDTATARAVVGGWPETLSRLKTLAETGIPFRIAPTYAPAAG
jgi:uncharacterized protein YndB with AHSA1/START domain/DNA-binding transcriptional ArsR family regulator